MSEKSSWIRFLIGAACGSVVAVTLMLWIAPSCPPAARSVVSSPVVPTSIPAVASDSTIVCEIHLTMNNDWLREAPTIGDSGLQASFRPHFTLPEAEKTRVTLAREGTGLRWTATARFPSAGLYLLEIEPMLWRGAVSLENGKRLEISMPTPWEITFDVVDARTMAKIGAAAVWYQVGNVNDSLFHGSVWPRFVHSGDGLKIRVATDSVYYGVSASDDYAETTMAIERGSDERRRTCFTRLSRFSGLSARVRMPIGSTRTIGKGEFTLENLDWLGHSREWNLESDVESPVHFKGIAPGQYRLTFRPQGSEDVISTETIVSEGQVVDEVLDFPSPAQRTPK